MQRKRRPVIGTTGNGHGGQGQERPIDNAASLGETLEGGELILIGIDFQGKGQSNSLDADRSLLRYPDGAAEVEVRSAFTVRSRTSSPMPVATARNSTPAPVTSGSWHGVLRCGPSVCDGPDEALGTATHFVVAGAPARSRLRPAGQ